MQTLIFEQNSEIVIMYVLDPNGKEIYELVPSGCRFKMVNEADLPVDVPMELWQYDFTDNDGTGTKIDEAIQ